ncbi:MFS transporter [Amycolatopsis aidingensis]|uniref:MFS transporter n=1 Tax=Amycolatopsis aidingensis TaxID=2842453 RepID=UPI001C0DF7D5|nr:MFS transporter [Amycolatopsis aidingensis]
MTHAVPRAGRREWLGLAVLVLPVLIVSMDITVLYLALPALSVDLAPSSTQHLWITDIYTFLLAGLLISMGSLGDRIGRRRLLLLGAGTFGLASVLAAFAASAEMLIGARALLGVAGATLMPSTLSLIRTMFADQRQRTSAIGIWTAGFAVGAGLGPLLGGALLQEFWWGSVFLVNVPVMALLLALGPFLLPEYSSPGAARVDLPSAALSLACVLPLVYAVKTLAVEGFGGTPVLAIALGVLFGVGFVRRQRRLADPMVDLSLFRVPAFSVSIGTSMIISFALVGSGLFVSQYLQLVRGMAPLEAGLWLLPGAMAAVTGAVVASVLAQRFRPATMVGAGLLLAAVGSLLIAQLSVHSGLTLVVVGGMLTGAGVTMTLSTTADLIIASAPPERAGAASGLSETSEKLGSAFGVAILGSIAAAVYRGKVVFLPPGSEEPARETLGGAIAAAEHLPEQARLDLLTIARSAFTSGIQLAMIVCVALLIITAFVAGILLRNVRRTTAEGNEQS